MKQEDIEDLKQLIEFLKEYQVAEFDLDRGDLKIRLKFSAAGGCWRIGRSGAFAGCCSGLRRRRRQPSPAANPAAPAPEAPDADAGLHMVKSPMVGTFYGSPSPGAGPFVSPGDLVTKGQVIGVVEAMKLMNDIESDAAGELVKCLVSNGQPVEYGQPCFRLGSARMHEVNE